MYPECKNCGSSIMWDDHNKDWIHLYTGDPQCTDEEGNLLATWGEPKE